MHSKDIVHRDIKPQNILIDDEGCIKIADLGQAVHLSDTEEARKVKGTYFFYSPECINGEDEYDPKLADIWAFGVSIYAVVFRCLPFRGSNMKQYFDAIQSQE